MHYEIEIQPVIGEYRGHYYRSSEWIAWTPLVSYPTLAAAKEEARLVAQQYHKRCRIVRVDRDERQVVS